MLDCAGYQESSFVRIVRCAHSISYKKFTFDGIVLCMRASVAHTAQCTHPAESQTVLNFNSKLYFISVIIIGWLHCTTKSQCRVSVCILYAATIWIALISDIWHGAGSSKRDPAKELIKSYQTACEQRDHLQLRQQEIDEWQILLTNERILLRSRCAALQRHINNLNKCIQKKRSKWQLIVI